MATIFDEARRKRQQQMDEAERGEAPAPSPPKEPEKKPFDFFRVKEDDPEVIAARARAKQRLLRGG